MNHITMHGSLTVNGRTVIVHVGDGEANATVDGRTSTCAAYGSFTSC